MTNESKIQQCQMTCCIKVNNPGKQVNYPCRWWRHYSDSLRDTEDNVLKNKIMPAKTASLPLISHTQMWKFFPAEVTLSRFLFSSARLSWSNRSKSSCSTMWKFQKKKVKNTSVSQQLCGMEQMLKMLWPLALGFLKDQMLGMSHTVYFRPGAKIYIHKCNTRET